MATPVCAFQGFARKETLVRLVLVSPRLYHWRLLFGNGISQDLLFNARQQKGNLDGLYYNPQLNIANSFELNTLL